MNIKSISISKDGAHKHVVAFSSDGVEIKKTMEIASIKGFDREGFARGFLLVVRQAERDFAYMKYGDEWRHHVGRYWGPITDKEIELLDEAAALIQPLLAPETIH